MPNWSPRSRWTTMPCWSISTRRTRSTRLGKSAALHESSPADGRIEDMETTPFRDYQPGTQPPYDAPDYGSTHKRHPQDGLVRLPHTITETSGPRFSAAQFPPIADLSMVNGKAALGERIIVHGRITDEAGRPIPDTIVEIWLANSAGRYHHPADQHDAPTDPNFHGGGRVYTDDDGW